MPRSARTSSKKMMNKGRRVCVDVSSMPGFEDEQMLLLTFTAGGAALCPGCGRGHRAGAPRRAPRDPACAGLPGRPAGYRGEVVPVIDLSLLLGSSPCSDRLSTRIILVKSMSGGQNQGEACARTGTGIGPGRVRLPRPDRRAGQRPGRGRARSSRPGAGAPAAGALPRLGRPDRSGVRAADRGREIGFGPSSFALGPW